VATIGLIPNILGNVSHDMVGGGVTTRSRAEDPHFGYRVLRTAHNAMITDPEAVTELLLDALELG
jgi:hypothetical protein